MRLHLQRPSGTIAPDLTPIEKPKEVLAPSLRVAAVQMSSEAGQITKNLEHATPLVEAAVAQGAQLVLLPELMPAGYTYAKSIWDGAEPANGPTVAWLKATSKRLGAWLGTSFLEAEGKHFYNTFVLTDPDGAVAGRVRKRQPALWEAYLYRGGDDSHVIDTKLGKIGVGICYENQLGFLPDELAKKDVDLILMPHAAPSPSPGIFSAEGIANYEADIQARAERMAHWLGVPVVFVNRTGVSRSPLPGTPLDAIKLSFPGSSTIVDNDGTEKARAGKDEAVLVEDVHLDPSKKTHPTESVAKGSWAFRVPKWSVAAHVIETVGALLYGLSHERAERAERAAHPRSAAKLRW